jgi:aspartyl-tRNA(Asn)/glutamyl-tRNA(Gln) amidotransferase subunit A
MSPSDIPFLSAAELGRRIKAREISPVDATHAYLDRIDSYDEQLHSYIMVAGEKALLRAHEMEEEILRGEDRGPLHGVPVAIKDQCHVNGWRTTGGSRILKDHVPDYDSTVVVNLREAGTVLLGKLNMTEFASGETFDFPYGTPRNPWDLTRSPGASSGGSGAGTAAFLCAASLGEDTGGSIRNPAAYSGVVGLRPTWGRVSRHGVIGACWSMDTVGPLTRTVEDCALMFQAIAGHDPNDPHTSEEPVHDYTLGLDGDISKLKVGLIKELIDPDIVDGEVAEAVLAATAVLVKLGATVEDVSLPILQHAAAIAQTISGVEGAFMRREYIYTRATDMDYLARVRALTGSLIPAQVYHKAMRLREVVRRQVLGILERFDVLICPSAPTEAPKIPTSPDIIKSKDEVLGNIWGRSRVNAPFSLSGQPALSVPCGFTSNDLPIGLQIAGRPLDEWTVFNVGHAYEQATPWHMKRPPFG